MRGPPCVVNVISKSGTTTEPAIAFAYSVVSGAHGGP